MPTFDEDLRERIAGAADWPEERDDLFVEIVARRRRRNRARKAGALVAVVVVLALLGGGFLAFDRSGNTAPQPAAPSIGNGDLVVSRNDPTGTHLYTLPADRMDLDPVDGAVPDTADQQPLTARQSGADVQPAVSPDGTLVAFLRCPQDPCTGGTVVTMSMDGSGEQSLPASPDAVSVAWSPDGTSLAIADAGGAVWLAHADGSALHQVAAHGVASVVDVAWSADGNRLVLAGSSGAGKPTDLWSVAIDGTDPVNLTGTPGVGEVQPAASPDGSWIVYLAGGDIDRIPASGGAPEQLIGSPAEQDAVLSRPAFSPDGSFLTFVIAGMATSTVYALPPNTDSAFPLTPGSTYAWQPHPAGGAVPPNLDTLGLPFSVCRVSTMPITTDLGPGTAAVYTRENDDGTCPGRGHGYTAVGADVDGDGGLDATYGPLLDCYFACEAFAAPDMTGDGTSEVIASNAGANGYGVWLFRVEGSPPLITPVLHDGAPFQFTWLDVATHAASARCQTVDGAPALLLDEVEKDPNPAQVTERTFVLDGDNAVPSGTHGYSTPLDQAPLPGSTLCGAPIQVPGARFAGATSQPAQSVPGVPFSVCRPLRLQGDFGAAGDAIWVFEEMPNGDCAQSEGFQRLALERNGSVVSMSPRITDMLGDDAYRAWPYALPDIDNDGMPDVALATAGVVPQAHHLWLLRLQGDAFVPWAQGCGPGCDPTPWSVEVGSVWHQDGTQSPSGLFCGQPHGSTDASQAALVYWEADGGDPLLVHETAWTPVGGVLNPAGTSTYRASTPAGYPPAATTELCGSAVQSAPTFPNYG